MLTLIAKIKAKKNSVDDLEKILTGLVKKVSEEEGTLEYVLYKSQVDPASFLFYEIYKDNDSLALHSTTDYFNEAMRAMSPFLDGKPEIESYVLVDKK